MSYYPKTCNFTIHSIFSNSSHVGWCTASSDIILKLDTLVMIQTKFGFNWSSSFRGEDFWKSLLRITDDDDGRQVMAIALMALWARWTKKLMDNRRWMKNGENSLQGTLSQTSYNLPMKAYNRNSVLSSQKLSTKWRGHHGHDRMVVGFTTTYAISAYHH